MVKVYVTKFFPVMWEIIKALGSLIWDLSKLAYELAADYLSCLFYVPKHRRRTHFWRENASSIACGAVGGLMFAGMICAGLLL